MNIKSLIESAESSTFRLWLLNRILLRSIPFNSPHRLQVTSAKPGHIVGRLPYFRKNRNHIGGMHACALATISEYISGLCLASVLSSEKYRFILQSLNMEYHYQGKSDCKVDFSISESELEEWVFVPLRDSDKITVELSVKVFDMQDNHICTATIFWQVKEWSSVKTK